MNQTKASLSATVDPYNASGYSRSRISYIAECTFEYFIALLVADPFLTKLLSYIGLDDATIGIIQSLISFAFLFQLASIFVVQRITNVKKVAATVHGISQLLFTCLYLVPFLPFAKEHKTVLIFVCFLAAYFGNYLVTSVIFRWGNSYVDPGKRARYGATKEMTSLISGVIVTLVMSWLIRHYEEAGELRTGFLFTAIVMAVVCALDFICLMLMKNRISEPPPKKDIVPPGQVIRILFTNKGFVSVIVLTAIWQCAYYMTLGFMGTYKQGELGLTVLSVQIINIGSQMARFAISRPFGKYTDKHSYAKGLALGMTVAAVGYFINMFTCPSLWWFVIVYTVLANVAMAGISQNLFNIVYNFVEEKYFVQASAIKQSIGGVVGFCASLIGSRILTAVQANGNTVLGLSLYGQQLLSAISLVLTIGAIAFTHLVLGKQKIMAK